MSEGAPGEDAFDRLEAGLPARTPEEAAARAPLERVFARIRDLPPLEPRPGWEDRARARRRAEQRSRRVRVVALAGGVAIAATAVVMLVVLRAAPSSSFEVDVALRAGGTFRGSALVQDRLRASARRSEAHVELRAYRDAALVVRCPGAPGCEVDGKRLALSLELDAPGTYRVVLLASDAPLPAPGDGGIDGDLLDAGRAGAEVRRWQPIVVSP